MKWVPSFRNKLTFFFYLMFRTLKHNIFCFPRMLDGGKRWGERWKSEILSEERIILGIPLSKNGTIWDVCCNMKQIYIYKKKSLWKSVSFGNNQSPLEIFRKSIVYQFGNNFVKINNSLDFSRVWKMTSKTSKRLFNF